jgi:hypothetical protein
MAPGPSYNETVTLALKRRTAGHEREITRIEMELETAQREDRLAAYLKQAPSVREQILRYLD